MRENEYGEPLATAWSEDLRPMCVVCFKSGYKVRHGVYAHSVPFGADGVGPNAHGFVIDEAFIEADRRRKERRRLVSESRIPEEEAHYLRSIGVEV